MNNAAAAATAAAIEGRRWVPVAGSGTISNTCPFRKPCDTYMLSRAVAKKKQDAVKSRSVGLSPLARRLHTGPHRMYNTQDKTHPLRFQAFLSPCFARNKGGRGGGGACMHHARMHHAGIMRACIMHARAHSKNGGFNPFRTAAPLWGDNSGHKYKGRMVLTWMYKRCIFSGPQRWVFCPQKRGLQSTTGLKKGSVPYIYIYMCIFWRTRRRRQAFFLLPSPGLSRKNHRGVNKKKKSVGGIGVCMCVCNLLALIYHSGRQQ